MNIFGEEEVKEILEWSKTNTRNFSWRKNTTPYRILVAEILLRRTTAPAVEKMYNDFIHRYSDLLTLSEASESTISAELRSIGYNIIRAKILKEVSRSLLSNYGGIPNSVDHLTSVKHIGLYIAGAILSLGFGIPFPMIDTNVLRILERFYGKKITQNKGLEILNPIIPNEFQHFNLALLDFAALVCKPKQPLCIECPIRKKCNYPMKNNLP